MESTEDKHLSKRSSLSILLSNKDSTSEKSTNNDIWYDSTMPITKHAHEGRASDIRNEEFNSNSPSTSKISCKDLILAIYENELCVEGEENLHQYSERNSPLLERFSLMAAEEDGTPMDDLPEFSTNSDVLAMGIEDFVLVNKKSSEKLVHVRITQGGDRSLTKIKNGSTFPVMQYSEVQAELNKQPSLGFMEFMELNHQDSDLSAGTDDTGMMSPIQEVVGSLENSGYEAPKMFRTQSEDEFIAAAAGGDEKNNRTSVDGLANSINSAELRMSDYKNSFEATSSYASTAPADSPRKRSWSENLIISCRRPGTDHWSSPKNIVVGRNTRKRATSAATHNLVKSPQQRIPRANGTGTFDEPEATQAYSTKKQHDMRYFIDTGIDPLKQYRSEQEIVHMRSNSSSLLMDDMVLSLNPHTSSSKLVLTPTNASTTTTSNSRPGSAVVSTAVTPITTTGNSGQKSGLPPTVPNNSNNNTKTSTANVLTTKELAAYFDQTSFPSDKNYSSDEYDLDKVGDDCDYDSGGEHVFSFVDSPEACKMYAKNSTNGKHITSNASVVSTAKGSSINDEEHPAYSSGSDYSASDYEAIHKINQEMALFHLHNGYPSGSPHVRNRSSSEVASKHLSFNGSSSASAVASEGRRRTSSEHPPTERRPSWFQSVFGLLSGQTSPAKKPSPMHRNSNASNVDTPGILQYNSKDTEEEEEDGEVSFVRDLDTGNVIELDEDGDGAVTAILISPDLIYGGK